MNEKEKAKELVEKFKKFSHAEIIDTGNFDSYEINIETELKNAKHCAIICVDEILKNNISMQKYLIGGGVTMENTNYWEQVKTEIEAL